MSDSNLGSIIVAIVALIGTIYTAILQRRSSREDASVEFGRSMSSAAKTLYEGLAERIEALERENTDLRGRLAGMEKYKDQEEALADALGRIETLEKEVNQLTVGIEILSKQVIELGDRPRFKRGVSPHG